MNKARKALCATALTSILVINSSPSFGQAEDSLPLQDLQIFAEVFGKIKSEYVDTVEDSQLLRDAVRGMLSGLDPHSAFLDAEGFREVRINTNGKFGGLGIEVTAEDGTIRVVAPIDGTPAHEAGVQAGDRIIRLDGELVRGLSLEEAVNKMRGEPGSEIVLTLIREGIAEPLEIAIVRAIIKITSVRSEILEPGLAYIRISSFQSGTAQSLRNQIERLIEKNNAPLNGLILDLRNNPGGVLSGAVEVSDMFLKDGSIVSTRGPTAQQDFVAKPDEVTDGAPMVVLVNGGSASASEIVAGALQDHRRAIILGTRTFGKGSVQTIIPMNNGGALKLTTARYYTPSNRSIQAKGIVPDIIAEQGQFTRLDPSHEQVSESDLSGHLQNNQEQTREKPDPERTVIVENDRQIKEALNLLKGMSLVRKMHSPAG